MASILSSSSSWESEYLSKKYEEWLRAHVPYGPHYLNARIATQKHYLDKRDLGIKPQDGAAVIFGPGLSVTHNLDFEPCFVTTQLAEHPAVIIADFSRAVLEDARACFREACPAIEKKIILARRDFSNGLSVRFDEYMIPRIDAIDDRDQLQEFMTHLVQIQETVIDELRDMDFSARPSRSPAGIIHEPAGYDAMAHYDFEAISGVSQPVRFAICNLLLAGMVATTEGTFRDKLIDISSREGQEISREIIRYYMGVWHDIISKVNTEISVNFLREVLQQNPQAQFSVITDETATYEGLEQYSRWDVGEVKRKLLTDSIRFYREKTWLMDDSHETPPHNHGITHFIFEKFNPDEGKLRSGDSGLNLVQISKGGSIPTLGERSEEQQMPSDSDVLSGAPGLSEQ